MTLCCREYLIIHYISFALQRITVEALVSRNHQDIKKVSITGAGHLRECKNTELVWELRKTGF